jgi:hypothetical protein
MSTDGEKRFADENCSASKQSANTRFGKGDYEEISMGVVNRRRGKGDIYSVATYRNERKN